MIETILTLLAIFVSIKIAELIHSPSKRDPNKSYYEPLSPGEINPYTGKEIE